MNSETALVSTVKSVVQVVKKLDESRLLYEKGLGLKCVAEEIFSANELTAAFGVTDGFFRFARFAREGEDFGCVDLIENIKASAPLRDQNRPFDYGIMTLNFRTNNIEKAVSILDKVGCEPVSQILQYNVGKPMREVMMITPTGERLTILEVGGTNYDLPVFNEAIATVGLVVPKMSQAKRFYEHVLGLKTAIAFQAAGTPFDSLLGVQVLNKLDFATLTAGSNWTGKIELLELETGEMPAGKFYNDRLLYTGYSHIRFLTDDIEKVAEKFRQYGIQFSLFSIGSDSFFYGCKKMILVCSPSGEFIEILEIT